MVKFDEIRNVPAVSKLGKLAIFAVCLWLIGLVIFSNALFIIDGNRERLKESDRILNGATMIKSYPARGFFAGEEPLAAVSSIIDKLGLKDRVSKMTSASTGLVVQLDRLYPNELTGLVEEFSKSGLSIATADISAAVSGKEGRTLTAVFSLEGARE